MPVTKVDSPVRGNTWLWLLLSVLAVRFLTMALLPVTDTTESRYAEISRLMEASGQWLVPQFEPGVPFWGKPPLFAWLSAGAMQLLGNAEVMIRLPHFLLALAVLWLTRKAGMHELDENRGWLALLVLASCPLFFVSMGTVMTESGLLFSTTLSMTGFWLAVKQGSKAWGLLFFAGLGLGMLAKGPVGPALTLIPITMWLATERRWRVLRRLPWLTGIVLCLVVFVPWYIAAERQSPGFLNYFVVGEHLLRFIQPGWEGDLYGNPHREWPGMIWVFWFQATAAWGVLFAWLWLRRAKTQHAETRDQRCWRRYLLSWMFAPLLLFTFSGNILWTYVITGLPALALLIAGMLQQRQRASGNAPLRSSLLISMAVLVPIASIIFTALAPRGYFSLLSEKALISHYIETTNDEPLYYLDYRPVSASFYSQREAGVIAGGATALPGPAFWLAVHRRDGRLPPWGCAQQHSPGSGLFDLYRCTP
ncbi:MAG: glycosyltransferase family 39 protein [Xanthomonadales bacterium]|nr:glycosyltransferase family 39 protein [Xanthomonadales bacterium]